MNAAPVRTWPGRCSPGVLLCVGGALVAGAFLATTPAMAQQAASPAGSVASASPASEEDLARTEEDLARQLANPVSSLISVPFQFNYVGGLNPGNTGQRVNLNIQPVIPFSLNPDWNLISRTILPVTWSSDLAPGSGELIGTSDTVQSLFLSPARPTANGIIWGAGPVFLLPTGSETLYSAHQWGIGPTAVALKQTGPWTFGVLANQLWSVARSANPAVDVSTTFVQPFITYTTPGAWSFTLNTESTYNWNTKKLQLPINAIVSKVVKVGPQLLSLALGVRYYAVSPDAGASGFGARATVTFLFPR